MCINGCHCGSSILGSKSDQGGEGVLLPLWPGPHGPRPDELRGIRDIARAAARIVRRGVYDLAEKYMEDMFGAILPKEAVLAVKSSLKQIACRNGSVPALGKQKREAMPLIWVQHATRGR